MATKLITASPAQLGYVKAVIEELPELTTIVARQRSMRMIFAMLQAMQPKRTRNIKYNQLYTIEKVYLIKTGDVVYGFHYEYDNKNEETEGGIINGN